MEIKEAVKEALKKHLRVEVETDSGFDNKDAPKASDEEVEKMTLQFQA